MDRWSMLNRANYVARGAACTSQCIFDLAFLCCDRSVIVFLTALISQSHISSKEHRYLCELRQHLIWIRYFTGKLVIVLHGTILLRVQVSTGNPFWLIKFFSVLRIYIFGSQQRRICATFTCRLTENESRLFNVNL